MEYIIGLIVVGAAYYAFFYKKESEQPAETPKVEEAKVEAVNAQPVAEAAPAKKPTTAKKKAPAKAKAAAAPKAKSTKKTAKPKA